MNNLSGLNQLRSGADPILSDLMALRSAVRSPQEKVWGASPAALTRGVYLLTSPNHSLRDNLSVPLSWLKRVGQSPLKSSAFGNFRCLSARSTINFQQSTPHQKVLETRTTVQRSSDMDMSHIFVSFTPVWLEQQKLTHKDCVVLGPVVHRRDAWGGLNTSLACSPCFCSALIAHISLCIALCLF